MMKKNISIPLCVDLDGTLTKVDTLHQSLFLLLRRQPMSLLSGLGWLKKGKANFKEEVSKRVELDVRVLPYHQSFLEYLKKEKKAGRTLILATAANHRTAQAVANYLNLFDAVFSSDATINLRGIKKRDLLQKKYATFDYAGNDLSDLPILEVARKKILVNPSHKILQKYVSQADLLFEDRPSFFRSLFKALRPQQWLKNLLIFSPLFLAHQFIFLPIINSLVAFVSFSLAASSIYVLNDLFDLSADQHHPRKRNRPFAAGNLSVSTGLFVIPILILFSLFFAFLLPSSFLTVLLFYYFLTLFYSWRLKQVELIDVLSLAVLYTLRIIAGGVATHILVSNWFMIFSIFLFLSLALVKRIAELKEMKKTAESEAVRERGYTLDDLFLLSAFGATSGYLATLVFTMYLNSERVAQLYTHPQLLWLFCPLLLYWITRIWLLTWRGQMKDDPLAFAAKDVTTYIVGGIGLTLILLAI